MSPVGRWLLSSNAQSSRADRPPPVPATAPHPVFARLSGPRDPESRAKREGSYDATVLICLIAPNDGIADPRTRPTRFLLEKAGHEVVMVLPVAGPDVPGTMRVSLPRPGLGDRLLRRTRDPRWRTARRSTALASAAALTGARVFIPTDPRALDAAIAAARTTDGVVARTPKMDRADDVDLVDIAPSHPELAAPVAGTGTFHTPSDDRGPYTPVPGRHSGRKVVLCYRKSEINPGRYLQAGLERSGVDLEVHTTGIDLSAVDPTTDFVIFVEGPYPALDVEGETPVPTLFWFHHGEHHLHANLRLADRYRADALLMAHSWHLAYWAPAPVHRFPFGMATELLDASRPMAHRRYDVALVGAGLHAGHQYDRRRQLVAAFEAALPPERLGFREQVSALEMAALYGDSRTVINEGGTRHYPITMRVLEAVGSGAVLVSDPLPGMEMLLDAGSEYLQMRPDPVAQMKDLLSDDQRLQQMADSALETALGLHTYDHRVDELFDIASRTEKRLIPKQEPLAAIARVIDRDVEVQRVAQVGLPGLADQLPSREVWDAAGMDPNRLSPGRMETVAIDADDLGGLRHLLRSARRYIYVAGPARGLDDFIAEDAPQAVVEEIDGIRRVDLMAASYRIMPFEGERV